MRLPRYSALQISLFCYFMHLLLQGKIAMSESWAGWCIVFLGWALWKKQIRPSFHILLYPLALYGLVSTISSLAAARSIHIYFEGMIWVKMATFPIGLMFFRELPWTRRTAMWCYLVFGTGMAVIGLFQYFVLNQRDLEHRIRGLETHVMTYSGLMLPMAVFLAILAVHMKRWWLWIPAVLSTLTLLLTFTRSAWLGWACAMLAVLLFTRPKMLAWAVPAVLLFLTFMPMDLFGRLISSFDTRQESNLDRIRMAEAGVEMIRDYPLLGVGPANVKEVYPLYRRHDSPRFRIPHLHNTVLQIWAERGVVALAAYLLLIALFLRECARAWHTPARAFAQIGLAVCVGLTVAGLFEFNFGDTEVFYLMLDLFAFTIAMMEANERPEDVVQWSSSRVVEASASRLA
jgi:O-antigen ligase